MTLQQSIHEYINEKKDIYICLLKFLESSDDENNNFQIFKEKISKGEYQGNKEEIYQILQIIQSISSNHHRGENLLDKIKKIIQYLKETIKQSLSDIEIFFIFMNNKAIIQFLLENQIISISKEIFKAMTSKIESNEIKYWHFFNNEIKAYIEESKNPEKRRKFLINDPQILENYDEKRKEGENDSFICALIRNDLVEEFISYVNKVNYPLNSEINPSIFETHSFLIENNPTLIEYAAFFGSIQIFQYLKMNKIDLTPSLWLYAIHSKNAEMIHILEENKVNPPNNDIQSCFIESIKCHHNEFANYFENDLISYNQNKLSEEIVSNVLHYHNYEYFPSNLEENYVFYHLCSNCYHKIVELLIKDKEEEIKEKEIKILLIS